MSESTGEVVAASVKLSELELHQLLQVHNLVRKQQEALVERNQALGRQVDALRAERAQVVDQIRKHADDLLHLSSLIKRKEGGGGGAPKVERSVGDVVSIDGEAPGVTLEAKAVG